MLIRLLFVALIAGVVYALLSGAWARMGPALTRDPRLRYLLAGFGAAALRGLLRAAAPTLSRWLSALRWFR
jgi:hypothetical protein